MAREPLHTTDTMTADVASINGSARSFLELRGLGMQFEASGGQVVEALSGIDLDVDEGQFVSIVGPSGCGKTTLLRALAGMTPATSGQAHLEGTLIVEPSRKVGVVFQRPVLLPWRTVLENVLVPVRVRRLRPVSAYAERARELLSMCGLDRFDELPTKLSGGMQQRVSLCRALIQDPKLLLMDEPFGALDAMTREHMNEELLRIWEKNRITVVLITHSVAEAAFLSDRVVVMSPQPGRLVADLTIDAPRPRTLSMLSRELADYTQEIRSMLGAGALD